ERLAREVQAVRTGQSDRLPTLETAELDGVVAEVNSLIEHNQRIVERARASASDLAHALKTPLAVMKSLEEGGNASSERRLQLEGMERNVTRQLARASAAWPGRRAAIPVATIDAEIARGITRHHATS